MNPGRPKGSKAHRFGGNWTTAKLDVIARYLSSYTTALKDKPTADRPFVKGYIDAFAGTGYRNAPHDDGSGELGQTLLFPDLAGEEPQALLDGSARLALKTQPRFDRYVFIERSAARCVQLESLKQEFPDLATDIQIRQGDANAEIQDLCTKDWSSHRAVLFLDPYGMQVEWRTIEVIAGTKAIDLWLLFPLGIGVNRLLTKSGDIPLELPLRWRKPQTIFVNSMSDLFHDDVPLAYISQVFDVMRRAHWHRFQLLTKRAQRLAELSSKLDWAPNIWMGVSVESDKYRPRIDELRSTNARVKFLSLEPLLGPLSKLNLEGIDWVIVGGESGPKARPMDPGWAADLPDQYRSLPGHLFQALAANDVGLFEGPFCAAGSSSTRPAVARGRPQSSAGTRSPADARVLPGVETARLSSCHCRGLHSRIACRRRAARARPRRRRRCGR